MSDTTTEQPVSGKPAGAPAPDGTPEGEAAPESKKITWQRIVHEVKEIALTIAFFVPFWLAFSTFVYELRSIPSESMVPALQVHDRVVVAKFTYGYNINSIPFSIGTMIFGNKNQKPDEGIWVRTPRRGDVVVFQHPRNPRVMIKRVIGVPGDRVQVKGGKLFLNGEEVARTFIRQTKYVPDGPAGPFTAVQTAYEYREQLPGEDGSHLIHEFSDTGDLDETPIFTVPAGNVFMMGDNRDNSEDSRAPSGHRSMAAQFPEAWPRRGTNLGQPSSEDAIGFVPIDHLIGRAETVLFTFHFCKQAPETECPAGRMWKGL
jgi:signal peptidase I